MTVPVTTGFPETSVKTPLPLYGKIHLHQCYGILTINLLGARMTYRYEGKVICSLCEERPAMARKLCKSCYAREWRKGSILEHKVISPEEAFLLRIEKTDSCWIWKGTKNEYGYGVFLLPGKTSSIRAHRFSYQIHKGEIPVGLVVMHSCDNPICVNPSHLSVGTKLDNNRDAIRKNRTRTGEAHQRSKLTDMQVDEIRASSLSQKEISEKYGVNQSQISRIKNGLRRPKRNFFNPE